MQEVLTLEVLDNVIPVVKAFSTWHTVWELSGGATGTPVTLVSRHTNNTLTRTRLTVTLQCFGTFPIAVASWNKISGDLH